MAGHSKFKNIMHRKGAQDKKRAKLFARLAREIQIAAREGGADPASNPRLRTALQTARSQNMSKDNIERAMARADSASDERLEEVRYEGYGPASSAVIVECLTDNRNRSASQVRACFSKRGGNLGRSNTVIHLFERVGEVAFDSETVGTDEERLMRAALEAGADDYELGDERTYFWTAEGELHTTADALARLLDASYLEAQLVWRPKAPIELEESKAAGALELLASLEDCDDVQQVFSNISIAD